MNIALGADHAGYQLKEHVKIYLEDKTDINSYDFGVYDETSVDYPDIARPLAQSVAMGDYDRGIIICGTGVGVSIVANKVPGIRAALCQEAFTARMARLHNDLNILTLGSRSTGAGLALDIVEVFITCSYEGGRHQRRLEKIEP